MNSSDDLVDQLFDEVKAGRISVEELDFLIANPHFKSKPVDLRTFIIEERFLNCPYAWPKILEITSEIMAPKDIGKRFSEFTEAVFNAGIGSGKSFLVSFVFCYVTYWLSCLRDPQAFYGLAPKSTICLMNASTTATQAKKVVFGKIQARIDESPYFQENFRPDPNIRSELRFPRDIVIFPGSSSETAPIGYDVLIAVVDEASFFISTDSRDAASAVFDTLDRRIRSRFEDRGLILTTSSPRYIDDFTEKKIEESKLDPSIYGIKISVWETKPRDIEAIRNGEYFELKPIGSKKLVKIPLAYERAFRKNPKKAWRDYGAIASLALESYFTDEELTRLETIMLQSKIPNSVTENNILNLNIMPKQGVTYSAHIDLGLKRDACGLAVGHSENEKVIIDFLIRIVCQKRANDLDDMGESYDMIIGDEQVIIGGLLPKKNGVLGLIYELSERGFFLSQVSFDGYQSAHAMQQLNENGIETALLSIDRNTGPYDTFKSVINLDSFDCPNHPHALGESRRLELIDGKKVDHPKNGSKDLTDAIAGVCYTLAIEMGEEVEEKEKIIDESVNLEIQPEI